MPQNAGRVCYIFGFAVACPSISLDETRSFTGTGSGVIGSVAIQRVFEHSLVRLSYDRDTRSTGGSGR